MLSGANVFRISGHKLKPEDSMQRIIKGRPFFVYVLIVRIVTYKEHPHE